jgi:MYXO-CTERM domain-containing protein
MHELNVRALVLLACWLALSGVAEARPTDVNGGDLHRYDASDTVEHYDSTNFRIFFTRAGKNAIPAGPVDGMNVPTYVTTVGQLYEDVLSFYLGRGFMQPLSDAMVVDNGGDGRFDVYLLDFAGTADGAFVREQCSGGTCEGYMVQENDFVGYHYSSAMVGNRVLASHEFFHAVQAAYSVDQDSVVAEGTAVWAEQQFDASLAFDLEGFTGGYLSMADHSLDRPGTGPVPAFSYGMSIFFEFLGEKLKPDLIRILWEDLRAGARGVAQQTWLPGLVALLPREYTTTFSDTLVSFATWNLFTRNRADPMRGYADGANYPLVEQLAAVLPYEDDALRVFYASQQVLTFDPAGRTQVAVAVVPAAGLGADSLMPLQIVIAPSTGAHIDAVSTHPATDPTPVAVGTATQVLVSLVQTNASGDSVRGVLCVGSPDEVSACQAKNTMAAADMGAMPMPEKHGCSCALGARAPVSWLPALLFVAVLVARRRRYR